MASASPHETTLVEATLAARSTSATPRRLLGDRAYDRDPPDRDLAARGIELIAAHRRNRTKSRAQGGRKPRRYRRRWKVERFFAWLSSHRWVTVRWGRYAENHFSFVHLGCLLMLLRAFLR